MDTLTTQAYKAERTAFHTRFACWRLTYADWRALWAPHVAARHVSKFIRVRDPAGGIDTGNAFIGAPGEGHAPMRVYARRRAQGK
jgi:hypothetical protein